jgi:hypothetical protein
MDTLTHDDIRAAVRARYGTIAETRGASAPPIAPQLIVVSTPPLNKTFEHMRGPPTLLGWCPTRRRYVQ